MCASKPPTGGRFKGGQLTLLLYSSFAWFDARGILSISAVFGLSLVCLVFCGLSLTCSVFWSVAFAGDIDNLGVVQESLTIDPYQVIGYVTLPSNSITISYSLKIIRLCVVMQQTMVGIAHPTLLFLLAVASNIGSFRMVRLVGSHGRSWG